MIKKLQKILLSLFSTQKYKHPNFQVQHDSFNAIHLEPLQIATQQQLDEIINQIMDNKDEDQVSSIWIHLSSLSLNFLTYLTSQKNFKIHRAKNQEISLYKWLLKRTDLVVPYSRLYIACGAIVIKDSKILLISQKQGFSKGLYGIPGGRADYGQCIQKCSERELYEELGIKADFKTLLWIREVNDTVYGSYDIYYGCLMKVQEDSLQNIVQCPIEIDNYEWVHLKDLPKFTQKNTIGSQLHLAKYLHKLYLQGFDFDNSNVSKYRSFIQHSPKDQKQRFMGFHQLI